MTRFAMLSSVAFVAAVLANCPPAASEEVGATVVVRPTGQYPADLEAVQAAVDRGGRVLLAATDERGRPRAFNFGPHDGGGNVELTTDVTIVGEQVARGTHIHGGSIPFFGVEPARTRIEGITFSGAGLSAAIFIRSTGVEFVHNRVIGVVGVPFSEPFEATEGQGIKFLGNSDPEGAITGRVVIAGNQFDDMRAELSYAIVLDSVAADVTIIDNRVERTAGGGLFALTQGGDLEVTDNWIRPGRGDGVLQFGNGVQVIGAAARLRIAGNTIHVENRMADPILLLAGDSSGLDPIEAPVILKNDITNEGTNFGAVTLYGDVNRARVVGNVVRGASDYAIGLFPFTGDESAVGNRLVGNNLVAFEAARANVIIESHAIGTVVGAHQGSIFDDGVDTIFLGDRVGTGSSNPASADHALRLVAIMRATG